MKKNKLYLLITKIGIVLLVLNGSCKKDNSLQSDIIKSLAIVNTANVMNINFNKAQSGGSISNSGNDSITEKGICFNKTGSPSITDTKISAGKDTTEFVTSLTGLTPKTKYFVKAYAINSKGVAYANEVTFITPEEIIFDTDGNSYHSIGIGSQVWLAENLSTTKFNDGSPIPKVLGNSNWGTYTPAYCWYNNDSISNKAVYGAIYNWYAVNTGKLCPTGWHVPSAGEWNVLITYLGGINVAGGKLKEIGTTHWQSPNSGADNSSGFNALPGGDCFFYGSFQNLGSFAEWWASSEYEAKIGFIYMVTSQFSNVTAGLGDKRSGLYVRCMRN